MRYVEPHPPILLIDDNGDPMHELDPKAPPPKKGELPATRPCVEKTYARWVEEFPLNDPKFRKGGWKTLYAAVKIRDAFRKAEKDGSAAEIEDEDWDILIDVVDDPSPERDGSKGFGLIMPALFQYFPFIRNIKNASTEEPAKKLASVGE